MKAFNGLFDIVLESSSCTNWVSFIVTVATPPPMILEGNLLDVISPCMATSSMKIIFTDIKKRFVCVSIELVAVCKTVVWVNYHASV